MTKKLGAISVPSSPLFCFHNNIYYNTIYSEGLVGMWLKSRLLRVNLEGRPETWE